MDNLLYNVGELSSPERSAVEAILGHALRDDQQFYIITVDATVEPTPDARRQAWNDLETIISEAHANVRQTGIAPHELEREIDQACNDVRYGK